MYAVKPDVLMLGRNATWDCLSWGRSFQLLLNAVPDLRSCLWFFELLSMSSLKVLITSQRIWVIVNHTKILEQSPGSHSVWFFFFFFFLTHCFLPKTHWLAVADTFGGCKSVPGGYQSDPTKFQLWSQRRLVALLKTSQLQLEKCLG